MPDLHQPALRHLIDGALVEGKGPARDIVNPASGQAIARVAGADASQTAAAIAAARRAQPAWAALAPLARASVMRKIASLVRRDAERLARLVVLEQGKPIREARGEVAGTAEFFDYFAEFARRIQGEILPSDFAGEQVWIQRVPLGVVAAIIPWNYPSALVARKVAPALIAGNTVVLKPHEMTPLSALALAEIFVDAGLPAGVVNIVAGTGAEVGALLTESPDVDLITMTGSVQTGKRIMTAAAANLTPVSLELGGKAPFIVCADANLDLAVRSAATSRYMNCGQVCICNERTLVDARIHDEFVERFIAFTARLKVGDPMDEATDIGPKVSPAELDKVERMLADAVADGARLAYGGGRPDPVPVRGGNWMNPVVLTNVRPGMAILRREVFGPVVPILPFDGFEQALEMANDTDYGLSAYVFTHDLRIVMTATERLRFGEVYINRVGPEMLQGFHGGFGDSGVGGDDGVHGLDHYLRKKTVYVNHSGRETAALMPYGR